MANNDSREASRKLLSTYELVENILSHLPTKDLARSSEVCGTWKDVTMRSQLLRTHLFLIPQVVKVATVPPMLVPAHSDRWSIKPHPILLRNDIDFSIYAPHFGYEWGFDLSVSDVKEMLEWTDKHWTTLLMTQPPSKMAVVRFKPSDLSKYIYKEDFIDEEGIKMGVMRQGMMVVSKYYEKHDVPDFWGDSIGGCLEVWGNSASTGSNC